VQHFSMTCMVIYGVGMFKISFWPCIFADYLWVFGYLHCLFCLFAFLYAVYILPMLNWTPHFFFVDENVLYNDQTTNIDISYE
jgi:hypothetical protein